MERSLLKGVAAFRWAAWAWMATVAVATRGRLDRPAIAVAAIALALAWTGGATAVVRSRPALLMHPEAVAAEVALGAALIVLDGVVHGPGHAFSPAQSLGSVWPLVGVIMAGVALGPAVGASAGVALGLSRAGSVALNGVTTLDGPHSMSLLNTAVFYALGGAVAGYVWRLLRDAESEVVSARERERWARTLHDGVLQTLALVERRTDDPALARLAREQERELREHLFGDPDRDAAPADDVGAALRAAAARFEVAFDGRAQVLVADDVPGLPPAHVEALAGAVREALTNAGKHGHATTVTVYCEPDDDGAGVSCFVRDDGEGFDVASTPERVGLRSSIRGRIEEVGGRADVASVPGSHTEVRLWLPTA